MVASHLTSYRYKPRPMDGNGLEISYEAPREQWPRAEGIFAADMVSRGLYPGLR